MYRYTIISWNKNRSVLSGAAGPPAVKKVEDSGERLDSPCGYYSITASRANRGSVRPRVRPIVLMLATSISVRSFGFGSASSYFSSLEIRSAR